MILTLILATIWVVVLALSGDSLFSPWLLFPLGLIETLVWVVLWGVALRWVQHEE